MIDREVKRYLVPTLPGRITRDCVEVVTAHDYDALLTYVDALKKDAARYRWLQEHVVATGLALWMGQHQTLSEAVDAARVAPTVEPKP